MQFYFSRHGDYDSNTMGLLPSEKKRLVSVRLRLQELGFAPEVCWTSEAKRSLETAKELFPTSRLVQRDLFENYANFTFNEVRFIAAGLLGRFSLRKNTAFVIHGAIPAMLALLLAERQGAGIDWDHLPPEITELDYGCGIFVEGARWQYLSPAS